MQEEPSKSQRLLNRVDRRDVFTRGVFIVALVVITGFNIVFFINQQAGTLRARQANIERQQEIEGYIKCILLLRYDNPELNPNSTREQVVAALDKCSERTK